MGGSPSSFSDEAGWRLASLPENRVMAGVQQLRNFRRFASKLTVAAENYRRVADRGGKRGRPETAADPAAAHLHLDRAEETAGPERGNAVFRRARGVPRRDWRDISRRA